jgi:hypothetical protein
MTLSAVDSLDYVIESGFIVTVNADNYRILDVNDTDSHHIMRKKALHFLITEDAVYDGRSFPACFQTAWVSHSFACSNSIHYEQNKRFSNCGLWVIPPTHQHNYFLCISRSATSIHAVAVLDSFRIGSLASKAEDHRKAVECLLIGICSFILSIIWAITYFLC